MIMDLLSAIASTTDLIFTLSTTLIVFILFIEMIRRYLRKLVTISALIVSCILTCVIVYTLFAVVIKDKLEIVCADIVISNNYAFTVIDDKPIMLPLDKNNSEKPSRYYLEKIIGYNVLLEPIKTEYKLYYIPSIDKLLDLRWLFHFQIPDILSHKNQWKYDDEKVYL